MKACSAGIFVLLILFTGCSRKQDGSPEIPDKETGVIGVNLTYDPSVPVNDGKKISISFWTQVDQEKIYSKLAADYMVIHPNVQIELTASHYKDHFNKLLIALQSEIGPDIFHLHNAYNDTLLPYMQPYPENALPREALLADFRQVESHIIDGSIYYIDTGLMTSSIYYNLDMWKEAELTERDIPRTWEELRMVARRLTKYDAQKNIIRAGFNPNGIGFSLFTAMNLQQGTPLFSGAGPSVPVLDAAASRRSLEFLRDLYYKDRVADVRFPEFHESFGMGNAAMIYAWGWTNSWLLKHHPDLKFDVFTLPAWTMETPVCFDRFNGESSMGVNRRAPKEKQDVAFDLIRYFLAKDDYLVEMSREFGVAPSKRSLVDHLSLKNDNLLSTFFNILDKTVWVGPFPDYYESTLTSTLIDPVIIDRASIEQSLDATLGELRRQFTQRRISDTGRILK